MNAANRVNPPNPRHVVIAGISTRAAAESAAHAGFTVSAIDAFADLDQHLSVRAHSLGRDFTAHKAARAAQAIECDAVVYLSNFENHPNAIATLAMGRALWGNPPQVVRQVRDPVRLSEALEKRGIAAPKVRLPASARHSASYGEASPKRANSSARDGGKLDATYVSDKSGESMDVTDTNRELYVVSGFSRTASDVRWLVKPLSSGGGRRIRHWQPGTELPRGCYLQELIDGVPGSVVFIAAGGHAVPLGITRQLVGEEAFGAHAYQYCGSILEHAPRADDSTSPQHETLAHRARALADAVADEFGLIGLNGIDFVIRDAAPHAVEVNPRWCASMELVERAYGVSILGAHAAACISGVLPEFDVAAARGERGAVGKAVVYSREDVTVGDTREWLANDEIRDVPHFGERIPAGRPVCTVFAAGDDQVACHAALIRCAERVYAQLEAGL